MRAASCARSWVPSSTTSGCPISTRRPSSSATCCRRRDRRPAPDPRRPDAGTLVKETVTERHGRHQRPGPEEDAGQSRPRPLIALRSGGDLSGSLRQVSSATSVFVSRVKGPLHPRDASGRPGKARDVVVQNRSNARPPRGERVCRRAVAAPARVLADGAGPPRSTPSRSSSRVVNTVAFKRREGERLVFADLSDMAVDAPEAGGVHSTWRSNVDADARGRSRRWRCGR